MSIVVAYDAIHVNVGQLPRGQACGYTTGSSDIRWTPQDWVTHPGAVRIDQDVAASDGTADVLDVERGAATFADCPAWAKRALASRAAMQRKGQRTPAIYTSQSNVSSVVNALLAGGVRNGVSLWMADWSIGENQADNYILDGSGPFPVIGVQFASGTYYDSDVFSSSWLSNTAGGPVPPPPPAQPPILHLGSTGAWVSTLQHDLNAKGAHPPLVIDGDFGPKTLTAVTDFQRRAGLKVDGIVGPATWKALGA